MSGIYIHGMEMPKNCVDCGFKINCDECEGYECFCAVLNRNIGYMPYNRSFLREDAPVVLSDCRLDDCPLVPVPPHGRLIDADALMNEMDKQENAMYEHEHEFSFSFKSGGDVCTAWYNVEMMVEDAPTIIQASGGKVNE